VRGCLESDSAKWADTQGLILRCTARVLFCVVGDCAQSDSAGWVVAQNLILEVGGTESVSSRWAAAHSLIQRGGCLHRF
jgi:hypothetical protein